MEFTSEAEFFRNETFRAAICDYRRHHCGHLEAYVDDTFQQVAPHDTSTYTPSEQRVTHTLKCLFK